MASNTLGLYSQASNTLATAFHNLSVQASGGGGGSQSLQQVLTVGNTTGGNDIIQTSGDALKSSTNANLRLELDGSGTVLVEQNNFAGASQPIMTLRTNDNSAGGSTIELFTNSTTPVAGDLVGNIEFNGNTNPVFKAQYGIIECQIADATFGSHDSRFNLVNYKNGLPQECLKVNPNGIKPLAIEDFFNSIGTVGQVLTCNNALTGQLLWATLPLTTGMTATGGTITTYYEGNTRYTAHFFTANGSFTLTSFGIQGVPLLDILIVGGGGGGGGYSTTTLVRGGGGGAGCMIQISDYPLNGDAVLPQSITITIGSGGLAGTTGATGANGGNGNNSSIVIPATLNNTGVSSATGQLPDLSTTTITATGGGGGAANTVAPTNGVVLSNSYGFQTHAGTAITALTPSSAGGGGAAGTSASGAQSTATFGSADADRSGGSRIVCGAFGGGTGSTATNSAAGGGGVLSKANNAQATQASGGAGMVSYWTGSKFAFGAGGSGGTTGAQIVCASDYYGGGRGGGQTPSADATAGVANTGSGGGGGATANGAGAGGSGFVIIRYKS